MNFAKRGFQTVISFYGIREEIESACRNCQACVDVCPVGAITLKTPSPQV
jgi:ferredoxin